MVNSFYPPAGPLHRMGVDSRVRAVNQAPARDGGRYVLYWRRANRRVRFNHALADAAMLANQLRLPLLVLDSLSSQEAYASDRFHTFALEGVAEAEAGLGAIGAGYCFSLERLPGQCGAGLREAVREAAAVVTDDYPDSVAGAIPEFDLACFAVDSSCVVPMRLTSERVWAAYSMRPRIRKQLPLYLSAPLPFALDVPYRAAPPSWHTCVTPESIPRLVAECDIDHSVPPISTCPGGEAAAAQQLQRFLDHGLQRYSVHKNHPNEQAASGLSPYLHLGHISALEAALETRLRADEGGLMSSEFLEELIVRRELAFNFALHAPRFDSLDLLPDWARQTLNRHRSDARPWVYTQEQFEAAGTHDDLWNAAQKELLLRGSIHGYYRMYWGKKILEWSASPEAALAVMIHLNDRYALDGRDPNGYTGILWCFGLHDRPWPERPIYGTVRSMSRGGMERKTSVRAYIESVEQLERTQRGSL